MANGKGKFGNNNLNPIVKYGNRQIKQIRKGSNIILDTRYGYSGSPIYMLNEGVAIGDDPNAFNFINFIPTTDLMGEEAGVMFELLDVEHIFSLATNQTLEFIYGNITYGAYLVFPAGTINLTVNVNGVPEQYNSLWRLGTSISLLHNYDKFDTTTPVVALDTTTAYFQKYTTYAPQANNGILTLTNIADVRIKITHNFFNRYYAHPYWMNDAYPNFNIKFYKDIYIAQNGYIEPSITPIATYNNISTSQTRSINSTDDIVVAFSISASNNMTGVMSMNCENNGGFNVSSYTDRYYDNINKTFSFLISAPTLYTASNVVFTLRCALAVLNFTLAVSKTLPTLTIKGYRNGTINVPAGIVEPLSIYTGSYIYIKTTTTSGIPSNISVTTNVSSNVAELEYVANGSAANTRVFLYTLNQTVSRQTITFTASEVSSTNNENVSYSIQIGTPSSGGD